MSPQPKLARLVIRKAPQQAPEAAPEAKTPKKPAKKRAAKKTMADTVAQFSGALKAVGEAVAPTPQTAVRDTPVHRFVEQLRAKDGIHYLTTAEVAAEFGVSVGWIHKIQRNPSVGAPSMIANLGKIRIYLYTPADVDEIRRYLVDQQQVYANPGPDARVESWEEVKKRREQSTQDADRQDDGDRTEGSTDADR